MYFFIDPQALPTQLPADRYGAIDADTCRIASVFTLVQPSGAYAMLAGNIIVQPCATDSSLLNIVIKPVHAVNTRTNQIRYIVYRGIRKSSLFNGTDLKQKSTLPENHFLYRMWTQLEQWNQKHPETEADKVMPNEMGYDTAIGAQVLIEHVFAGAVPGVFPTYVKEGMILGDFAAGAIAIEVILTHDPVPSSVTDSRIDIGYLRKEEHLIDVTGLTGLERSAKQELLHRYVDIAALLGTAHNVGIYAPDEQAGTVDKYKGQSLYDSVISKFDTANTIYIDIRNDSGYSYNFYGKYGDTNGNDIQVVDAQQHVDTDVYGNDGWPILELDGKTVDYSDLGLRLRTDHNVRPVLYVQYVDIGDIYYKRFTDSTALLNEDTTPGWTKDITLHMPQVTQGGNTYSLAQYLALNYFEAAEQPVGGTQNRGISSLNEIDAYYNNAFCAIQLVDLDETAFTQAVQTEAAYVNGSLPDSDIHFSYAADAGVNWDSSKVVFFAHQIHTKERSSINNAVYENTGREGLGLEGSANNNSFLNKELSIYKITVQEETDVDSYEEVEILKMHHNGSANGGYEDVSFLGITRTEYQQLRATTGLSEHHLAYPYLEMVDGEARLDKDGLYYYRYRLGMVGMDNNREWAVGFPTLDIEIYSSDGLLFASKSFAEETLVFQFTNLGEEIIQTLTTFLTWNSSEADLVFEGIHEMDRGKITWEEFDSLYITGTEYEYSFVEPPTETYDTPDINYSPIDAPAYFTQAEFNDVVDNAQNNINSDPIEFYLIAVYKHSRLLNSSTYSVSNASFKIGEFILTPHYDDDNILKFYAAFRNINRGIEYIVKADALETFKSNYTLYEAAANAFYINGIPSRAQIQMAAGDYFEGLTSSWKEASRNPAYYIYMTHVLYGIGVNTAGISFRSSTIRNTKKISITIENHSSSQFRNLIQQKHGGSWVEIGPNRYRLVSGNDSYTSYPSTSSGQQFYDIEYFRNGKSVGVFRFKSN